jgi:ApaG protein
VTTATTDGIRVQVQATYRPERSSPAAGRWLFSYAVRIENGGTQTARLLSRHWIITDAHGRLDEVVGDGVVGKQPRLRPGEAFEYTSFCVLGTPHGSMRGSYKMLREDGQSFEAAIAPFPLVRADALQ